MDSKGIKTTERLGMNRRNFIKLAVGGAIGTALSPLPWKLTDDIAIWTQNLPWVPVPPAGEFTYARSVCMLCPGGCGIKVRKVEARAVKIEGRTDFPVNPGGLCPLGMGGLQLLYNEQIRFTGPMKRVGARGTGSFQAITWDEALGTLAKRISGLRDKGKIGTLAAIDGNHNGSTTSAMIEGLLRSLGSSNYMRMQTSQDTFEQAAYILTGNRGKAGFDLENADYILSFGSGLLEGWGSPGRVLNAWSLWKSGYRSDSVRIVQVEPRASNTASRADSWFPVKPGTESALALGIAHVIIKENLYNSDFVEEYSFGFYDFRSADGVEHKGFKTLVLENYSPEKVSLITGLGAGDIQLLARNFADASAPLAICGRGKGALYGSLYESMAVLALNALVGGINRKGGIFINEPVPVAGLPFPEPDASAKTSLDKGHIDIAGGGSFPFSQGLLSWLVESIMKENESPIDTLLVFSANPLFTVPGAGDLREALDRIPFIASFSPYRDETSMVADLILPDHNYLEKMDDMTSPEGLQYPLYCLSSPVVDPLYDTKNSGDAILELSKAIGGSMAEAFPWEEYEDVIQARVNGLFDAGVGMASYDDRKPPWEVQGDITWPDYGDFDQMLKDIKENGLWYCPLSSKDPGGIFKTASGKFEFYSGLIDTALKGTDPKTLGIKASGDEVCMPHFEDMPTEADGSFPLRMYPYDLINLSSGWIPNPPYLNKTLLDDQLKKDESFVDINPDTAEELGIKQGDRVFIESPKGRIRALVNIFEGAMPGIVFMPLGFGHSAYDDFLRGKGANPNDIISGGKDPLSGQAVWWDTPVRVIKA